jgi:hypothetical protein
MVGTFKVGKQFLWAGAIQRRPGAQGSARQLPRAERRQSDRNYGGKISLVEIIPDGLGGYIERPASLALSD